MKVKPLWTIVALALLAAPLAADAQRAGRTPRVGMLYVGTLQGGNRCDEAFRAGLAELGYIEGKSVFLEVRAGEGKLDRLGELAADLVRLKVDVIFAPGTVVAQSAKRAKVTTPSSSPAPRTRSDRGSSRGSVVPGGISRGCP